VDGGQIVSALPAQLSTHGDLKRYLCATDLRINEEGSKIYVKKGTDPGSMYATDTDPSVLPEGDNLDVEVFMIKSKPDYGYYLPCCIPYIYVMMVVCGHR
jgi:hypothetical protein